VNDAPKKPGLDDSYRELFENNRKWVEGRLAEDPSYFANLAKGQKPRYLWIGCSDSRVPANEITGTRSGEIFVHRNVANLVVHTDINMLSVLQYSVEVLEVEHVIVCGHYGCGGIQAALSHQDLGLINKWLRHIKDVYRMHRESLRPIEDKAELARRMVELNVVEQVHNLAKTTIIQHAWQSRRAPQIHGWVYDVGEGLIRDLGVNFSSPEGLEDFYRYDAIERDASK
jgi:carbonic anhydrase